MALQVAALLILIPAPALASTAPSATQARDKSLHRGEREFQRLSGQWRHADTSCHLRAGSVIWRCKVNVNNSHTFCRYNINVLRRNGKVVTRLRASGCVA